MNAFSTADSPQKSCCTEGTNSSIATTPATNRTKCPWKESECTRATHIWQTCFSLKSRSRDGESCSQESGSVKSADSAINLELQEKIWQILDEDSEIDGGVTRLTTGDLALRIFGHRAQKLQQVAEKIKKIYENKRT